MQSRLMLVGLASISQLFPNPTQHLPYLCHPPSVFGGANIKNICLYICVAFEVLVDFFFVNVLHMSLCRELLEILDIYWNFGKSPGTFSNWTVYSKS